ncbi:MAG: RsmE family RNA methyltransferase [Rickettsiales bacterium]
MFNNIRRIYLNLDVMSNQVMQITDKNLLLRLTKVLRISEKDQIKVFNEVNGEFLAEVIKINKKNIELRILKKLRNVEDLKKIRILIPIIKPDRMKWLVEKATELGVTEIIFFNSKRMQKREVNLDKVKYYIIAACEQSERIYLPKVSIIEKINEYIDDNLDIKFIVLNERDNQKFISSYLAEDPDINTFIFGPEGGFDSKEVEDMSGRSNVFSAHLGQYILRAETAVIFTISIFNSFKTSNTDYPRKNA